MTHDLNVLICQKLSHWLSVTYFSLLFNKFLYVLSFILLTSNYELFDNSISSLIKSVLQLLSSNISNYIFLLFYGAILLFFITYN